MPWLAAPDLRYVEQAARAIAPQLRTGNLVILESTSPVGATEKLAGWLAEKRPDLRFPLAGSRETDVHLAYCPERVLPGSTVSELVKNDRVIGGLTPLCAQKARHLYKTFVRGECIETDARTAEMTKLTENAFRDVNIAFANELSLICDQLGIDVWELITLANRHPRVNILNPGPGVGGHCIAVDPWFIVNSAPDTAHLIRTAREVNDSKPEWVLNRISDAVMQCRRDKEDVVVACLGLAFKANIDDLRESPSLHIVEKLVAVSLATWSGLRASEVIIISLTSPVCCSLRRILRQTRKRMLGWPSLPKSCLSRWRTSSMTTAAISRRVFAITACRRRFAFGRWH